MAIEHIGQPGQFNDGNGIQELEDDPTTKLKFPSSREIDQRKLVSEMKRAIEIGSNH